MNSPEISKRLEVVARSPEAAGLLGVTTCEHLCTTDGTVVGVERTRNSIFTAGMPCAPGNLTPKSGVSCPRFFKCPPCPNSRANKKRED
jgi:hypothetical protein